MCDQERNGALISPGSSAYGLRVDIEIQKGSPRCVECGVDFDTAEEHYSVLRPERKPARADYCLSCWKKYAFSADIYAFWLKKFQKANPEQPPPKDVDRLLAVCYDCIHADDRAGDALAHMSAMILWRQKVFRLVRRYFDRTGECDVFVFLDKLNGTHLSIRDPDLSIEEMDEAWQQLRSLLGLMEEEAEHE